MYKIYLTTGSVKETESLKEVQEYEKQGCTYEKILDEFSPEQLTEEQVDALCAISQAIPGL